MVVHKYFVVHGHFYQPIRINPFLGELPIEPSAYPYENWDKRILRECYLPNTFAHVKDEDLVIDIVNNYKNISFDMGYTLLGWLDQNASWLLGILKEASSNALALSFNHTILPLDPSFDKELQVYWGIKTHEHYFGEKPKGMWLPECAVNLETLEIFYQYGIEYIILAPHQVSNKTSKNYGHIKLKNGNIKVFIYDGIISAKLSFEDLLTDVNKLEEAFKQSGDMIPIVATDGETFGHHKKFGEMGLAYLSKIISLKALNQLIEELKDFDYEFEVIENTSWSCPHGIERWRTHCGCNSGAHPDWNQYWRAPLREALEFLRREGLSLLEKVLLDFKLKKDVLFDYIDIILGVKDVETFLTEKGIKKEEDQTKIAKLLSAYKCVQFTFSSDAWFFDDVSGIEVQHALEMAKYVIYTLKDYEDLEIPFVNILEKAKGNTKERPTAKDVYIKDVKVYKLEDIAYTIAIMHYYGYLESEGSFTKFRYEVNNQDNYIYIFIKNLETLEKNSFEFNIRDFDVYKLFSTFRKRLVEFILEKNTEKYIEHYEMLLEDIGSKVHNIEAMSEFIKQQKEFLESISKEILVYMFKHDKEIESISSLYNKLLNMNINPKTRYISIEGTKYIFRQAKKLPDNEKEFLKILAFVRLYNKNEQDPSLMMGIWEAQNEAWFKKDLIQNKSILDALHLSY